MEDVFVSLIEVEEAKADKAIKDAKEKPAA